MDAKTDGMMADGQGDGNDDSGISSAGSSRRESLSSNASFATDPSAASSRSSGFGSATQSLSDRRSSVSSNASWSSTGTRYSQNSSDLFSPNSSRRSSLSSVLSDDSTTTIQSDVTMTSQQPGRSSNNRGISQPVYQPTQVLVVDYNGKTHPIDVKLTDTVRSLKKKIKDRRIGPDPSQQTLTCNGKTLTDERTLQGYGVQNLSKVSLTSQLVGGAVIKSASVY